MTDVKRYEPELANFDTFGRDPFLQVSEKTNGNYVEYTDYEALQKKQDACSAELENHIRALKAMRYDLDNTRDQRDALQRQLRRLQTGAEIESDRLTEHELVQQVEIDALKARVAELGAETKGSIIEGHEKPCYYCGELCSSIAGNPSRWPIPLCHADDPGHVKWHHIECVSSRLARLTELEAGQAALAEFNELNLASMHTLLRIEVLERDEARSRLTSLEEHFNTPAEGAFSTLPKEDQLTFLRDADAHHRAEIQRLRARLAVLEAPGSRRPVDENGEPIPVTLDGVYWKERWLATKEIHAAPPVVPKGFKVFFDDEDPKGWCWSVDQGAPGWTEGFCPPDLLWRVELARAWAAKNNKRPPHEDDPETTNG